MDALRVVANVRDTEELLRLREENASLRRDLDLWRGDVPDVGSHVHMDDELMIIHGWDFSQLNVAWRYDGGEWLSVTWYDGSVHLHWYHHFTSPFQHRPNDSFGRSGWIRVRLDTYELHRVFPVEFEAANDGHMYLSASDQPMEKDDGVYDAMETLHF